MVVTSRAPRVVGSSRSSRGWVRRRRGRTAGQHAYAAQLLRHTGSLGSSGGSPGEEVSTRSTRHSRCYPPAGAPPSGGPPRHECVMTTRWWSHPGSGTRAGPLGGRSGGVIHPPSVRDWVSNIHPPFHPTRVGCMLCSAPCVPPVPNSPTTSTGSVRDWVRCSSHSGCPPAIRDSYSTRLGVDHQLVVTSTAAPGIQ